MRGRSTKHDWYFNAVSKKNHPELLQMNEGLKQLAGISDAAVHKAEDEALAAKRRAEDLKIKKQRQSVKTAPKKKVGK
jgi:hypothetical protein